MSSSATEPLLLDFQNVYVQRGERYALNGVSLSVRSGEHVAILGPNGSGKSTLIKTVTRECYPLLRPETRLRIAGQESWNIFELRSQLGLVSNDLMARCTREITGRELVLSGFFGSIGIWPGQHHVTPEMEQQALAAMEQVEAAHLAERWLDELSSGEARRLLIARSMIHEPSTLLLDEPTTSLDLTALREVRTHLRSLGEERGGAVAGDASLGRYYSGDRSGGAPAGWQDSGGWTERESADGEESFGDVSGAGVGGAAGRVLPCVVTRYSFTFAGSSLSSAKTEAPLRRMRVTDEPASGPGRLAGTKSGGKASTSLPLSS